MQAKTWFDALHICHQHGRAYVLITVLTHAGSTPREAGTKMLVTDDSQYDTIGGGHLEYEVIAKSRELLALNETCTKTISYPLSSSLGQCCGGAMKVLYEVMVTHQQHLAVFGAGHVAQSLVPLLAQLPLQIKWIDGRAQFFEHLPVNVKQSLGHASNVRMISNDEPVEELSTLTDNTWLVILTHNHQLDYELIETALKHPKLGFIGMIGSSTKAKRFRTKLAHRGFSDQQIARITSPIGDLSISGKRPVEVAVSISAQLMKMLNKDASLNKNNSMREHQRKETVGKAGQS